MMARAGDWQAVELFFADRTPDDQAYFIDILGDENGIEALLADVIRRNRSVLALTVLARRYIVLAWEARTTRLAKDVSQEQFRAMREHLCRAEPLLIEAAAREPGFPPVWNTRLTSSKGLELGVAETGRRYARVEAIAPHFLRAQSAYLDQLYPKWGGSWERAFAFVRERIAAAPPGSPQGILIVQAHLERWCWLDDGEDSAYIASDEVCREVIDAALRSVLHPSFQRTPGWVGAHSHFAAFMSLIGDRQKAAVHFRAMGDFADERPWNRLYGDARAQFRRARARALKGES